MKKILIIEDDSSLGSILDQKMKASGYEVKLCGDGREGFEAIQTFAPDLILLDMAMPSMNGYEVLEAKSKDPRTEPIPVIVISNSGQPVEISHALTLGVKDFIIKAQFDIGDVLLKVRQQLEGIKKVGGVPTASLSGKKIMVVEDDKFLSDLVTRKLSSEGSVLVTANTGEDALSLIEAKRPDIILLDILLPGMSGLEVLEKLKKDDKKKHIPVILLSNFGQKTDIDKGKELGAARFMLKAAVSFDEIISAIKQVMAEPESLMKD